MMKKLLLLAAALCCPALAHALDFVFREDTASQTVYIGPFLNASGTPMEELTISASDVQISKAGGSFSAKNSGGCTHAAGGMYACTFDATDTSTVGALQILVAEAGALPVRHNARVFEEAVFDRDLAASATGIIGTAQTGDSFARLGAPAGASLSADLAAVENLVDDLETRLTSTRAGYLDNLSAGAVATASALTTVDGVVDAIKAVVDSMADGSGTLLGCSFTIDASPGAGEYYISVDSCTAP